MRRRKDNDNDKAMMLEDVQLERALLAGLLTDIYGTAAMKLLQGVVVEDDFTDDTMRDTWRVIATCYDKGKELSPLNIYSVGKEMGIDVEIQRFISRESLWADAETIGRTLHSLGQRRRMADGLQEIFMTLLYDKDTTNEQAIADIDRLVKDMTATTDTPTETFKEVYGRLLKVTQDIHNGVIPQGIKSGFSLIDDKGGLERGELMVVGGRNSNGKTSLALCMALNVAKQGVPVGIFSLEMTNIKLTARLTSLLTGIDGQQIRRADLTQDEWGRFTGVDDSLPIYFDKRRSTDGDTLMSNIKAMVAQLGVQVVVIDYLQLLRGRERELNQQLGGIAHRLESLSKQLEICVILISQLRRNQPNDPTPRLEELKESGDIADAADSIYLVYRPERHGDGLKYPTMSQDWSQYPTKGTALLMCMKNRLGAMGGEQLVAFDAPTTRFYEREIKPDFGANSIPSVNDFDE